MKALLLSGVSLVMFVHASFGQGTFTVTFERGSRVGVGATVYNYQQGGMTFTSIYGNAFTLQGMNGGDPDLSFLPDNGTAYVQTANSETLSFSSSTGGLFILQSVDLAEYSTVFQEPTTVQFIGYRPDGSFITQDFTTDGIIDGTGPLADFQTFTFGSDWTGLSRVDIPTYGWSLDNLVITPAPEPGTLGLGALGIGALLYAVRKTKSS